MTDKTRDKIRDALKSVGRQQPDSWMCMVMNRTRPTIDAMYQDIEAGIWDGKRSWMIDRLASRSRKLFYKKKNLILAILKRAGWRGE